ncbi:hypothetical protein QJQ58_15725 [Paenibacillus dendritiformis]|uniref:hypothetical protein n=1 Tax=Paenibacillus dendritiformis TaxID=130049 RepID=UPI00248CE89B|nr:hypothetical protein [Paenibacillus dendritiformis]WGU92061.1 hypothetical protein QJQ58_15725 [Paenibacillus dendritiformis]
MKKYIANLIGVPPSNLSMFLSGDKPLERQKKLIKLKIVLEQAIEAKKQTLDLIK